MKAQWLPSDIINTLPQNIIEIILCLMPIRDAVRTSILSRKWRYNWVNIPKLVFDEEELFKVSTNENQLSKRCNLFYIVSQVLLLHRGPILHFTLSLSTLRSCSEIDEIILHLLSNNIVKEFTLDFHSSQGYKLPSSFFSLKQLTNLELYNCELLPPSTFIGFGRLTSLALLHVKISTKMILHLLSNCPLLKTFLLIESNDVHQDEGNSNVVELFECLPAVKHLCMNYSAVKCFAVGGVPRELLTSLAHLTQFFVLEAEMNKYELSFAFLLMRSSPKLKKISIEILYNVRSPELVELEDYSDVCLDHLTELEIINFTNFITQLEFLKLILVKSPILQRVRIELDCKISSEEELKMSRIFLCLPRASPMVEIIVSRSLTLP